MLTVPINQEKTTFFVFFSLYLIILSRMKVKDISGSFPLNKRPERRRRASKQWKKRMKNWWENSFQLPSCKRPPSSKFSPRRLCETLLWSRLQPNTSPHADLNPSSCSERRNETRDIKVNNLLSVVCSSTILGLVPGVRVAAPQPAVLSSVWGRCLQDCCFCSVLQLCCVPPALAAPTTSCQMPTGLEWIWCWSSSARMPACNTISSSWGVWRRWRSR